MTEAALVTLTAALRGLTPAPEHVCRPLGGGDWMVVVTSSIQYDAQAVEDLATAHGVSARTNRAEYF